jgi:gas vesicle structural protein
MTDQLAGPLTKREVSLVEILDRALGAGIVITGDLTISLADVDLVYLDLRVLVGSVGTIRKGDGDTAGSEAWSIGRGEEDAA